HSCHAPPRPRSPLFPYTTLFRSSCRVYWRFCSLPSTATRRPLLRLRAQTSASLRHVTMGKKSVSRSPLSFLKGLSTASRKFVTAVPLTEYLNSGSEAKRPTRIVLFSTLITPRINPAPHGHAHDAAPARFCDTL